MNNREIALRLKEDTDYQVFFKNALKRFGSKTPADMSDEEKDEFFTWIENNWNDEDPATDDKDVVDEDEQLRSAIRKEIAAALTEAQGNDATMKKLHTIIASNPKTESEFLSKVKSKNIFQNSTEQTILKGLFKDYKKDSNWKYNDSKYSLEESILTEDAKKVWSYKGVYLVDSDFVNFCKGKLPNSELKHAGMGNFFLETPDGSIHFDRANGALDGMTGRAHQITDTSKDKKLFPLLMKKMGAKIIKESKNKEVIVEGKNIYHFKNMIRGGMINVNLKNDKAAQDYADRLGSRWQMVNIGEAVDYLRELQEIAEAKEASLKEDNEKGSIMVIKIAEDDGYYPWYFKKIDGTHFFMANNKKALSTGAAMAHHVGQHRGRTYYKDLADWLHGKIPSAKMNGKKYK